MATYDLTSSVPTKIAVGDILNCPYSGTYKTITLPKGVYKLECWGAQGGLYNTSTTAPYCRGGYSIGNLTLLNKTTVYLYAGGQGEATTNTNNMAHGGFNGGGACWGTEDGNAGGGGASDIRIGVDSLYARVIVAGGGGGEGEDNEGPGYGGGLTAGANGTGISGGTQIGTGTGGAFGIGASTNYDGGGCGGGWYGGGTNGGTQSLLTSRGSGSDTSGGSGGSGYVYTESTASNYPSGCLLNSNYYLTDAQTIAGNASMPSTSGSTETGHSGNGYVRITVIEAGGSLPLRVKVSGAIKEATAGYVKVNGIWKEISSLYIKVDNVWNLTGGSGDSGGSSISFDAYGRATINGNEVVNLGLPSGLLWATCNVGTNTETGTGNYYRYGLGSTTYNSSQSSYTGLENPLSLSYDTARQVMGGDFRMPTNTEMQELINNTNHSWVTINSVSGMKFTCKTDSNKYVFFPAAGRYASGSLGYTTYAYVISSTPNTTAYSYFLVMNSSSAFVDNGAERDRGFSVRGVISQ